MALERFQEAGGSKNIHYFTKIFKKYLIFLITDAAAPKVYLGTHHRGPGPHVGNNTF